MGNYATVSDVRGEGVGSEYTDTRINSRIDKWEQIIEQLTGQIFYVSSPGELVFDGNDATLMHFNIPIVTLNSIKVNGGSVALASDEFRAFTGRAQPQDDRRNPKIQLTPVRSSIYRDISAVFIKGLDQLIDADWGFVEDDGLGGYRAPLPIKHAIIELVTLDLQDYFTKSTTGGTALPLTSVRRERTDGHEIEYQQVTDARVVWSMLPSGIVDTLALYRRPMRMKSPAPPRFLPQVLLGVAIFRD